MEDEEIEQLSFIPRGVRSEVFRRILKVLIQCQRTNFNTYVVEDILNDRIVLAKLDQLLPEHRRVYDKKA